MSYISQEIFSREDENNEWEFHLINHQEKSYCKIPKQYNGLCMKWYCSRESDLFGIHLVNKTKGYDLVTFENM